MQTDAQALAKKSSETGQSEHLTWGLAEFQVTDLNRTITFWTQALGLRVREQDSKRVELGTQTQTLFVFHSGASKSVSSGHMGMYHVAIGVPDQNEFSRLLARLIALRVPVSPTDHLMSKALYLGDPDGLEIEIALETPERFSRFGDLTNALIMYDSNGKPHSGRERLDTNVELSHAQDADLEAPLSEGAFIAHMHFKVGNLDAATEWFEGIGFARNLMLPSWGFADMGAGAAYTHRLAMNTWAGPNLPPAPADMARLIRYELHVHNPEVMANVQGLDSSASTLIGHDPTGIEITLTPTF